MTKQNTCGSTKSSRQLGYLPSPVAKLIHSATSFTVTDERREHDQQERITLTRFLGLFLLADISELFGSWLLAFDLGAWRLCHQPAIDYNISYRLIASLWRITCTRSCATGLFIGTQGSNTHKLARAHTPSYRTAESLAARTASMPCEAASELGSRPQSQRGQPIKHKPARGAETNQTHTQFRDQAAWTSQCACLIHLVQKRAARYDGLAVGVGERLVNTMLPLSCYTMPQIDTVMTKE